VLIVVILTYTVVWHAKEMAARAHESAFTVCHSTVDFLTTLQTYFVMDPETFSMVGTHSQ
jgi:hypothetical protein